MRLAFWTSISVLLGGDAVRAASAAALTTDGESAGGAYMLTLLSASATLAERSTSLDARRSSTPRAIPLGRVFDVPFPAGLPLGITLNNDLVVTGFRSPRAEAARLASLDRLRFGSTPPSRGGLSERGAAGGALAAEVTSTGGVSATLSHPRPALLPFSLAEYSGAVCVGDVLVGVNGVATWSAHPQDVSEMMMEGGRREVVLTFVRPAASRGREGGVGHAAGASPPDPYALYMQKLARSVLPVSRSGGGSTRPARAVWHVDPLHDVTVRVQVGAGSPLALALAVHAGGGGQQLDGPLTVLTADPFEVERLSARGAPVPLYSAAYAASVLLRRGPLTGWVWGGDELVAVNGLRVDSQSLEEVLGELGASADAHAHTGEDGYVALGTAAYGGAGGPPALPVLGHVTLPTGGEAGDTGLLCVLGGRYCRMMTDPLDDVRLVKDVAAALRNGTSEGRVTRHVSLTFRRPARVPVALLASSRVAPLAAAAARREEGGGAGSAHATAAGHSRGDGTANETVGGPRTELVCTSTAGRRRCSFRSGDTVMLRLGSVGADTAAAGAQAASLPPPPGVRPPAAAPGANRAASGHYAAAAGPPLLSVPAKFGGAFSCGETALVVGIPSDGCRPLLTLGGAGRDALSPVGMGIPGAESMLGGPPLSYRGAVVVVDRGGCSFPSKAVTVQDAGGVGVIVVNTGDGAPFAMPGSEVGQPVSGGDGARVAIATLMVDEQTGATVRAAVAAARVSGRAAVLHFDSTDGACAADAAAQAASGSTAPASGVDGGSATSAVGGQPPVMDPWAVAAALSRAYKRRQQAQRGGGDDADRGGVGEEEDGGEHAHVATERLLGHVLGEAESPPSDEGEEGDERPAGV